MPKRRANGEGSIFQRKDGLWAAQYTDNTGTKRTLYGKTQQIVKAKLKEAIKHSDNGLVVDKSKVTFADWLTEWLEVYQKPTVRESTHIRACKRIKNHIIPAFPKVLLKDLRADMLQRFFNEKAVGSRQDGKEGGLSVSELYNMRQIISQALNQAIENNIILTNVADKVKLPKKTKPEIAVLTIEEQRLLENVLINYRNPLSFMILLDLYTGLRAGELIGLKISDIDFEKKEITIRRSVGRIDMPNGDRRSKKVVTEPKTLKGKRCIPLPVFLVEKLKVYIAERNEFVEAMAPIWSEAIVRGNSIYPKMGDGWKDEGNVFVTRFGTQPEASLLRKMLNDCLKQAGVRHINFHALRHTFATRCIEMGFDVRSLADILGHTDAKMTLNTYD